MERAFLHKSKTAGFGNIEARRTETFAAVRDARRSRRAQDFNRFRNIDGGIPVQPELTQAESRQKKELERKNALKKFVEKKEAKKQAAKQKQRPPFVVGIPHHGSSPVLRDLSNKNLTEKKGLGKNEVKKEEVSRVTRAASAKVGMKAPLLTKVPNSKSIKTKKIKSPVKVFPFVKNKSQFTFQCTKPLTEPHTPEVLKRSIRKTLKLDNMSGMQMKKKVPFKIDSANIKSATTRKRVVKNKDSVNQAVSNGSLTDQALSFNNFGNEVASINKPETDQTSTVDNSANEEVSIVNLTNDETSQASQSETDQASLNYSFNDKASINKSMEDQASLTDGTGQQEASTSQAATEKTEQPPDHQDIKPENPEAFKQRERVRTETAKLLELADTWQQVNSSGNLPQDLADEIDSLVGQTRLLTRDKFQQMIRVIDEFENPLPNAPLVSLDDVEGFWDMIYLQVSPLKKRYTKLEQLKQNNWEEPNSPPKRKRVKRIKPETIASKTEDVYKKTPRRSKRSTKHFSGDTLLTALPSLLDQPNCQGEDQTPRRSLRLASHPPTPLLAKPCSYCDSPDCHNTGCRTVVSASGKQSKPTPAKKFILKPSTLVVPDSVNNEIASATQSRGRKSRRLQIIEQNNAATAEPSPQARSRRVTFNYADDEKQSMKLPATPYNRRSRGSSRNPTDS